MMDVHSTEIIKEFFAHSITNDDHQSDERKRTRFYRERLYQGPQIMNG
jgi:hypothetical protein